MKIRVCSGWHPAGSALYGRRFLDSFDRFWPKEVELAVYTEQPESMPRAAYRDLFSIPGAPLVHDAMIAQAKFSGTVVTSKWKEGDRAEGYNFRFDAAKFWKQIMIPDHAATGLVDGDILIWLDGDVVTTRPVPLDLVPDLLGLADVCFLGREPKHSEIGFWAVRISPITRLFLECIKNQYLTGSFEQLKEWHSAFVWDHVRRSMGMRERNLCPPGARGHVWPTTKIGQFTRHDKGNRKNVVRG